jgi:hypothetical protein
MTCANGKYLAAWANDASNDALDDCTDCQAGKFHATTGATCGACPPGKFNAAAGVNTACATCGAGEYQDGTEQTGCKTCANGKYLAAWTNDASNDALDDCTDCQAGKFHAATGATCGACPTGKFNGAAGVNTACATCGAGEYQDDTEQSGCKACANGKYLAAWTTESSNDAASDCTDCQAGKFHASTGATCKACAYGHRTHRVHRDPDGLPDGLPDCCPDGCSDGG